MKNLKLLHREEDKIVSSLLVDLDSNNILESVGSPDWFKNFESMIEFGCFEMSNSIYIQMDNYWFFLCKSDRLQLILKFENVQGLNKALLEIEALRFLEAYSNE